jgi:hypothetical protein
VNVLAEKVEGLEMRGMRDAGYEMRNSTTHPASRISHPEETRSPFAFLRALRRVAPDSKDWG